MSISSKWKLLGVLVGCLVYAAASSTAHAQSGSAQYSKEALDALVPLINKAEKDGYTMDTRSTTIFGGWLKKDDKNWFAILTLTNLDPNREYRIVVSGDNDVRDLDVRVLDPQRKIVAEDVATDKSGSVTFRPTRQQDYTIEMRLYDSRDNSVCMGAWLRK